MNSKISSLVGGGEEYLENSYSNFYWDLMKFIINLSTKVNLTL